MISEPLPWRVRAWAMENDDGLLCIGGFAYQPNDTIAAFLIKKPGIGKYPVSIHRAGLMAMAEAKRLGYRRIVALADKTNDAAERWLKRFGFKEVMIDSEQAWVWEASN